MSHQHHKPAPSEPTAALAHELANLLDGSMRHIRLMMSALRDASDNQTPAAAPGADSNSAGGDDLVARLQTVNEAMLQMASLIQRWMGRDPRPGDPAIGPITLGQCVAQAAGLLSEVADQHRVDIEIDLADHAEALPAGPTYPIIANALRNSIEAIADDPHRPAGRRGRIRVAGRVEDSHVLLRISDNGPGIAADLFDARGRFRFGTTGKPHGHGLGLALARDIARSLGGELKLENPPAGGAALTLRYPRAASADALWVSPHDRTTAHPDR